MSNTKDAVARSNEVNMIVPRILGLSNVVDSGDVG
jgi:hypothetical protein